MTDTPSIFEEFLQLDTQTWEQFEAARVAVDGLVTQLKDNIGSKHDELFELFSQCVELHAQLAYLADEGEKVGQCIAAYDTWATSSKMQSAVSKVLATLSDEVAKKYFYKFHPCQIR